MTTSKPAKTNTPIRDDEPDAEFREPTKAEWDEVEAWIARNKDELNANIREAREQYARGQYRTLEEVVALLDADRRERLKKK
jgi:flagellar biosynthesis/type III secretory pathway protein FliH